MDPLPPDPYAALNVPRDATSAAIKSSYRKLALKYHPDKAKDKGEEFHRIQQAYELIGEDDARRKHDDHVKLFDLRRDVYARRGSQGPNVDVRTSSFDARPSSGPGAGFTARGMPVYEERRPNPSNMGPSAARSPYAEEEAFDSYFSPRSASRKYDGYEASPRKPAPGKATPTKSAPRSEEVREALKQEKASSFKTRNEKKKQRDVEKGRERRGKFAASFGGPESEESDEGFFDSSARRAPPFEQERSRKDSRDTYEEDHRAEKLQNQRSNIREYMNRSKSEAFPVEKAAASTDQFQRSSSSQDLPLHSRPQQPQDPPYEIRRSRDSKPAMVRKSSSKPKEKTPELAKTKEKTPEPVRSSKASAKDPRAKTAERASPEPAHVTSERRPPPLYTSFSSPDELKIPKSRTPDEAEPRSGFPPRAERSSTMPSVPPLKRQSTRKGSTTPAVSSNLRQMETNDSGYSTSNNSPSETPQPGNSYSKTYQYGADSVQVDPGDNEHEPILRESERFLRRSPSPIDEPPPRERERRPQPTRERGSERGPAARSASFQTAEPDRHSRRPSLPRRTSSGRGNGSSGRVPTLERGASSPIPSSLRAGGSPAAKDGLYFGEIPTDSPIDLRDFNFGGSSGRGQGVRRMADDANVRYAPRYSPDDISYGHYASQPMGGNSGYYSPGTGRRGSEDYTSRSSKVDAAYAHMAGSRERGGMKRGSTFVH